MSEPVNETPDVPAVWWSADREAFVRKSRWDGEYVILAGVRDLDAALPSDAVRLVPQGEPHPEDQWRIAVDVPQSLDVDMRQELFAAVVRAVEDWEPQDRDGWDADVSGFPHSHSADLSGLRAELEDTQRRALVALKARDDALDDLDETRAENERLEKLYDAALKVMAAHLDSVRAAEVHCHLEHAPDQAGTGDTAQPDDVIEQPAETINGAMPGSMPCLRRIDAERAAKALHRDGLLAARPDEPPVCAAQAKYGLATWRCDLPAGHDGHHQETRPHIVGWEDA